MSIFYFSESYSKGKDAGNKARNDVEKILSRKYKKLQPYEINNTNKLFRALKVLRTTMSVSKNDYIIIQYPLPRGLNWMAEILTKIRKCVFIIHDLYELRIENFSGDEARKIKRAYGIVSHNRKMTKFLTDSGIDEKKIVNLKVFDYLIEPEEIPMHDKDESILCFAGNLAKSEFIYNISSKVTNLGVNIYGANYNENKNNALLYQGSFDSEIIHKEIKGKLGLVWDGKSVNTCDGSFGKYMKYNNPHKVSMYISAAMPIVIWKEAALAEFVEENKIGFTIDKIDDIYEIDKNLDAEQYRTINNNLIKLREKVIHGKMLETALDKIFEV